MVRGRGRQVTKRKKDTRWEVKGGGNVRNMKGERMGCLLESTQKCRIWKRTEREAWVKERAMGCNARLWIKLGEIQDKKESVSLPGERKKEEEELI